MFLCGKHQLNKTEIFQSKGNVLILGENPSIPQQELLVKHPGLRMDDIFHCIATRYGKRGLNSHIWIKSPICLLTASERALLIPLL